MTISWQAPQADPLITIASYRLVANETQFGLDDIVASSTVTSYTLNGLEEYNTYTCSVVAISTVSTTSDEVTTSFSTPQAGTNSTIDVGHVGLLKQEVIP